MMMVVAILFDMMIRTNNSFVYIFVSFSPLLLLFSIIVVIITITSIILFEEISG